MGIAAAEDRANNERLRYVTENFESLQGLKSVGIWGCLFLTEIEHVPGVALPWWLWLLSFGLFFAAFRYIPKYYERRFGSVESRVAPIHPFVAILVLIFIVMLFLWPVLAGYANPVVAEVGNVSHEVSNVAHRMISDPDHRANLLPVLYWLAFFCSGISSRQPFVRLRMVFFSACVLLFWTVVLAFLPLRHAEVTQQVPWRVLNAGWFGISMILLGLNDHLMLVQLLPGRGQNHDDE
jgi:hypothetical protein